MWNVGRLTWAIALFIASAMILGCGKHGQNELPTPNGAFVTVTNEYPGVVQVIGPGGAGLCTGSFISPRAVLTAAHCLDNVGTYTVLTSFGAFKSSVRRAFGPGLVDDPNDMGLLIFDKDVASREAGQVYDLHDDVRTGDVLELVGFGCNNIVTRTGAGVKRKGSNTVSTVNEYIEFLTPLSSVSSGHALFGPSNRTASCFGDSGGPAFQMVGGVPRVAGVTHAGGQEGSNQLSQYVNVATGRDNRDYLKDLDQEFGLGIRGL